MNNFSKHRKTIYLLLLFYFSFIQLYAQQESRFGKTVPANGSLRILVLYIEMDYDVNPDDDPTKGNGDWTEWKKGEMPKWKDDFLSIDSMHLQQGKLTRFYATSSFNNLIILGDYYPKLITIKESEVKNTADGMYQIDKIKSMVMADTPIVSQHKMTIDDFDLWTFTRYGEQKITPSKDSPHKFDHIMFIYRNLKNLPDANGRAVPGSPGKIFGYNADSYSTFGAHNSMPFNIARHEFTHLFLGDNNFHVGGGERMGNGAYFMSIQCMWSIIGAANASLLTCNGWDRDRFDWKPSFKQMTISAIDESDKEVSTDITVPFENEKTFFLRDFMLSGDVIRIKLPGVPDEDFSQYLWIENHQTTRKNNNEFDQFQYESYDCREKAQSGIYMYVQVDRDNKKGASIYYGHADYLHPLSAEGAYDYLFDTTKVKNTCVNEVEYPVVTISEKYQNPLTGTQSLEIPPLNLDRNDNLTYPETGMPVIEKQNGNYIRRLRNLGTAKVAFNNNTLNYISNFTNPATTNVITSYSGSPLKTAELLKRNTTIQFNSKAIYLNGLYLKMTDSLNDGNIKVRLGFDDFRITKNLRWCADSIVHNDSRHGLQITNKAVLTIDQGLTPTRAEKPILFKDQKVFASPSIFTLSENCEMQIESGCKLVIDNNSKIYLQKGSKLIVEEKGVIEIKNGAQIFLNETTIILEKGARMIIYGKQNLIGNYLSQIKFESSKQLKIK